MPLAAGRALDAIPEQDDGLLASAVDHGMHGLLWTWVRDHAPRYSERTTLAGLDAATRQRHGRLWDTLCRVRSDLAQIGVEIATLKGVTAEARWYARPGERPCADVDVLVDTAAAGRADEILALLQPGHPLGLEIKELVRSRAMQSVNVRVDGRSVDLHFDLLKLGIPTTHEDLLWERMLDQPLPDGTTVLVPDPETSLVNFLLHLNKDGFPRLLGFADVARILGAEQLDWVFVERFLHGEGLEVVGDCALTAVTQHLGISAPRLTRARGVRTRAWRAAWPDGVMLLGGTGVNRSRRQDLIPLLARARTVDTLRWARRIAFPPASTVALRYPDIAGPYLWRVARGRVRTTTERRAALRARHTPRAALAPPTAAREPSTTARLMRRRAASEPLWLNVRGSSMGWSIPDGARVRVEPVSVPRRGEVWAFCNTRGDIIVHRSRGATTDGHRFHGDARVRSDDPVAPEALIGRVVEIMPPQPTRRWGPAAGAVQRVPRLAVATATRSLRRIKRTAHR